MWLASHLEKFLIESFNDKQKILLKILRYWDKIIGCQYKNNVIPADIVFKKQMRNCATLVVICKIPALAMEVHMLSPVIIEKINIYFGYKLIKKIKII